MSYGIKRQQHQRKRQLTSKALKANMRLQPTATVATAPFASAEDCRWSAYEEREMPNQKIMDKDRKGG
jgi:hypothetical protein